ncbi:MAG: glutathione S-transferase family protein [Pseudomonadales bacterium]|jgi:glutathione S-transferase|nr:glutathione S-transferase family protein [Pseudomonadales bacterium]
MIRLYTTERAYDWGVLRSTHASKVKFALAEKGLPWEVERLHPGDLWKKPPAMRAVHPLAKVPWIVDDGFGVYDSTVILEWLEERYPEPPLLPRDPKARAEARMVETWADEALLVGALPGIWMPLWQGPAKRDAAAQEAARERLRSDALPWLEARLGDGREWLCGAFSIADVALAPAAMVLQVDGTDLSAAPRFASYLERLRARPAYRVIAPGTSLEDSERSA